MTYTIIWAAAFIIFIIVELATVSLTSIWFAGGALVALVAHLLGAGLVVQILLFAAVSALLLVLTKPWANKHVNSNIEQTNYTALYGQTVKITEAVNNINQTGKTLINDQEWSVRSENPDETFEVGELADIVSISGIKLIVKKHNSAPECSAEAESNNK